MNDRPIWSGVYGSFAETGAQPTVFDGGAWLDKLETRTRAVLQSPTIEHALSDLVISRDYALAPVVATLLTADQPRRVVDFGGGLGATYYEILAAVPKAEALLDYTIVETPAVCARAKTVLPAAPRPTFYDSVSAVPDSADIVHVGSALHYINDWRGTLAQLAKLAPRFFLFAELPADNITESYVTLQDFYGSPLPVWIWNLAEFVATMNELGYTLAYGTRFHANYRGRFGAPPMESLPAERRLSTFCQLMFRQTETSTNHV